MSNLLINWWRGRQFSAALKQGNTRLAERLLQESQNSGARLSWLEKLFRDKLQSAQSAHQYMREAATLSRQLRQALQRIEKLEQKLEFYQPDKFILKPDTNFINCVSKKFNLIEHDEYKLQCTGIDQDVFDDLEASLAKYLEEEFVKFPSERLSTAINNAFRDISCLKNRQDPQYSFELTPHVYFLQYFLDNVYCAYLCWFLICKFGMLPNKLNILDIAAGPGTVAYGIALFLRSSNGFLQMPQMHISYYSLEKQSSFQYRGLQFWRRYIEPQQTATNAYFRFDTTDIFAYDDTFKKLPQAFFDFIVISHCFFADQEQRNKSYKIYRKIFSENLTAKGYVLIIVQGTKLFRAYNVRQSEVLSQEQSLVRRFVEELGLSLEWYKYITSTGRRDFIEDFSKFVRELPYQKFMSTLKRQHLGVKFDSHYTIDDYVILAKR